MITTHIKMVTTSICWCLSFMYGVMLSAGCTSDIDNSDEHLSTKVELSGLSPEQMNLLSKLPRNIVIGHRGTTFWAPEETEAAMRWARNMGADYLECDLQMTKDGYLIALHDNNLSRTTDIAEKFSGRENLPANDFTLEELWQLDAGSWFNHAYPSRAQATFVGLDILLFEDVIQIAMGNKIERESYPNGKRKYDIIQNGSTSTIVPRYVKDEKDNGNRPGVYPETKEPWQFKDIELKLKQELLRLGWYAEGGGSLLQIDTISGKSVMGGTPFRVILQTFSKESLQKLHQQFNNPLIPIDFLLWYNPDNKSGSEMNNMGPQSYANWINYGAQNGAIIIGPSISGPPNDYPNMLEPWMADLIRRSGMQIHGYSFDTEEQMLKYSGVWYTSQYGLGKNLVDGWFTNKTGMTRDFFQGPLQEKYLQGENYFISNAGTGFQDNLQLGKEHPTPTEVLQELDYMP